MTASPEPPAPTRAPARAARTGLIVLSLTLQFVASTRIFCPPRGLSGLAPLRVACPPRLWPFTDYPMFSEPHRAGDTLAWIGVRFEYPSGFASPRGKFEVRRAAPEEPWASAFEREEARLRAELAPQLAGEDRSARIAFERILLVLTGRGLCRPDGDAAPGESK